MTAIHKRLRVFAGPNGSGKSTITNIVMDHVHLGEYVNADELKIILSRDRQLDFFAYNVNLNAQQFSESLRLSSLAERVPDIENTLSNIIFEGNRLILRENYTVEDYFVSFITSYIWNRLLETSNRFTIETVMSHHSKLDFMRLAKENGFKVYLYFVSLADPELNIRRVQTRVAQGGHAVDEDKIRQRYYRTMNNLYEALKIADNAYLFDNSGTEPNMFAVKETEVLTIKSDYVPKWFVTYVIEAINNSKRLLQ